MTVFVSKGPLCHLRRQSPSVLQFLGVAQAVRLHRPKPEVSPCLVLHVNMTPLTQLLQVENVAENHLADWAAGIAKSISGFIGKGEGW